MSLLKEGREGKIISPRRIRPQQEQLNRLGFYLFLDLVYRFLIKVLELHPPETG